MKILLFIILMVSYSAYADVTKTLFCVKNLIKQKNYDSATKLLYNLSTSNIIDKIKSNGYSTLFWCNYFTGKIEFKSGDFKKSIISLRKSIALVESDEIFTDPIPFYNAIMLLKYALIKETAQFDEPDYEAFVYLREEFDKLICACESQQPLYTKTAWELAQLLNILENAKNINDSLSIIIPKINEFDASNELDFYELSNLMLEFLKDRRNESQVHLDCFLSYNPDLKYLSSKEINQLSEWYFSVDNYDKGFETVLFGISNLPAEKVDDLIELFILWSEHADLDIINKFETVLINLETRHCLTKNWNKKLKLIEKYYNSPKLSVFKNYRMALIIKNDSELKTLMDSEMNTGHPWYFITKRILFFLKDDQNDKITFLISYNPNGIENISKYNDLKNHWNLLNNICEKRPEYKLVVFKMWHEIISKIIKNYL